MIKGLSLIYSSLIHPLISNWLNNWLIIFISRRTIRGQCPNIIMYKGTVCPKINIYQKIRKKENIVVDLENKRRNYVNFFLVYAAWNRESFEILINFFITRISLSLLIQRFFYFHWLHNYYIEGMYYVINQ